MARHLDSVCKLCRREGLKLYLKGSRCEGPKCAVDPDRRRNVGPGMHGYRRGKLSEYGVRLREKQRLKRFYGIFERQFRRYFSLASRSPENTGEVLLSILERRLDNVVHRLGFAPSRAAARQLVSHGHVQVNGNTCNIPSLSLKAGDTIAVKNRGPRARKESQKRAQRQNRGALMLVKLNLADKHAPIPDFLEITSTDPPEGRITRLPTRSDVDPRLSSDRPLEEQLIIEVCSR